MNPAENYILKQPEPYREILLHLQWLIEKTIPEVVLLFKYNVPFYYLKKRPICYLNASHKRKYVDLGICRGKQINIHEEYLVSENRKKMVSLRYINLEEINEEILIAVLKKAASLY